MPAPPPDLDLDATRSETFALLQQAFVNGSLPRSEVMWLCSTIADLIWKIQGDWPKAAE